jgi:hypothetical protein
MFESLKIWIYGFDFTSWMGFLLYWLPLSLCVYGYTIRTWLNYQKDVKDRESMEFYSPTDTIGTLIGRGLASTIPVVNLWAASFDVAPRLFSALFKWLGRIFDQPLVPKKK